MISRNLCILLLIALPAQAQNLADSLLGVPDMTNCCRICTSGQACGGACISEEIGCNAPRGCACNAPQVPTLIQSEPGFEVWLRGRDTLRVLGDYAWQLRGHDITTHIDGIGTWRLPRIVYKLWIRGDLDHLGTYESLENSVRQRGPPADTFQSDTMAYRDEILTDSPRAYWRLGDSVGATAVDETANSFDGTYRNSPTLEATGLIDDADTCVDFAGGGTDPPSADVSSGATLFGTVGTISIELWIRADVLSGKQTIFEAGGGGQGVHIHTDGTTLYGVVVVSSAVYTVSTTIAIDTTYHVVLTFDSGAELNLYVNKVEVDSNISVPSNTDWGSNVGSIAASHGARYADTTLQSTATWENGFDGKIDEVALYASVLSPTRITAHYDAGVASGTTVTPSETSQAQTSETPSLTQIHEVSPSETSQAQTSETPALTQVHDLAPSETSQSQAAENPALSQVHDVAPSETSQSQASETPSVSQVHSLTADETSQAQASENPAATVPGTVNPESTSQTQASENPAVTQIHNLTASDTSQAQTSDTPSAWPTVVPSDTSQAQTSENPSATVGSGVSPVDTSQSQTSENPALSQTHSVTPDGTLQVQTSENPTITTTGSKEFGSGTPTATRAITGTPTAALSVTGQPA